MVLLDFQAVPVDLPLTALSTTHALVPGVEVYQWHQPWGVANTAIHMLGWIL